MCHRLWQALALPAELQQCLVKLVTDLTPYIELHGMSETMLLEVSRLHRLLESWGLDVPSLPPLPRVNTCMQMAGELPAAKYTTAEAQKLCTERFPVLLLQIKTAKVHITRL